MSLPKILLFVGFGTGLFLSLQPNAFAGKHNCWVRVKYKTTLATTHMIKFGNDLGSKKECRKLAEFHTPNYEPERYPVKEVAFRWTKKPSKAVRF
jgi:hypothetical protein